MKNRHISIAKLRALEIVRIAAMAGLTATVLASAADRAMSFEDALSGSDLVVVGTIIKSPEIGVYDSTLGVIKHHTVWVERYVKGEGPDEITVITRGGKYWRETEAGRELYEGISSVAPQLPPEGSEVLLFLRTWGSGYLIYSATHGVVPVETEPDGTRSILLLFSRPEGMPPETRKAYEEGLARGSKPGQLLYGGRVGLEKLKAVADGILRTHP